VAGISEEYEQQVCAAMVAAVRRGGSRGSVRLRLPPSR